MAKSITTPTIGEHLYQLLSELCDATRHHATAHRDYHAAALYVVLEALRVQAEQGHDVTVHVHLAETVRP